MKDFNYFNNGILDFVSLEPDPYKIHLDLSKTAFKVGKRSLYSMHRGTSSIVLPLPFKEVLTYKSFQEYTKLAKLDVAYANAESIKDRSISNAEISKNTAILGYLNQEHYRLWKGYHMAPNKKVYLKKI